MIDIDTILKMKNIKLFTLLFVLAGVTFSSCRKESFFDPEEQFEAEKPIIENYVKANIPDAIKHENTGIWYEILETADENEDPYEYTIHSSGYINNVDIEIKYRGVLLDGTVFDSNTEGVTFSLGELIRAWQVMFLPKTIGDLPVGGILEEGLQKGMKVRFVTPSYYAYQHIGQGNVPANAPLDFTIEVLDIRDPVTPQE